MPMSPDDIANAVEVFAQEAIDWSDTQSEDRIKAMEYYDGVMRDTPSEVGRSEVVSKDFRSITKKVLPAITRTIFGSDKVVEYAPVGPDDEEMAEQATDYVNNIVMVECSGEERIRDAIHDALRLRNGILKWWYDERIDVRVTRHSGATIEDLAAVASEDDVEIVDQTTSDDGTFSVKLRRTIKGGRVSIACIPLEEFFISPDALTIEDAVFVAHNQKLKRYQLVAMGYDRDQVRSLPAYTGKTEQDDEVQTRRDDPETRAAMSERIKDMEEVDYWECFVRLDVDDDGIAELRRIVFAGGWKSNHILENDECDEAPFTDVVIERRPHEWQGRSLFDDVHEIQRVKTKLLRETLDNIYAQNNQQPIFQDGAVMNPDSLYEPAFGKPIKVRQGTDVRAAISDRVIPFVAKTSFEMLGYMDDALTDRTGISDQSGGLPPDALQNVTAKASALMEQQGISQVELMVRNVAVGLKRLFRGILKLVIQHQDKPRMVRLRGHAVQFDPRSWDATMDASVNVGLGAGTRERDMMAMNVVVGTQKEIMATLGADNPLVTPDQFYNGLSKLYQAAGIKQINSYLTRPDPEKVKQQLEAAASKPSPEEIKAQAQMQLEQMKAQVQMELENKRMEVEASKEREQRDADLIVKRAEIDANREKTMIEMDANMRLELSRIEAQSRAQLEHDLIMLDRQQAFEREKMVHSERMAATKMANDNMNRDIDRSANDDA